MCVEGYRSISRVELGLSDWHVHVPVHFAEAIVIIAQLDSEFAFFSPACSQGALDGPVGIWSFYLSSLLPAAVSIVNWWFSLKSTLTLVFLSKVPTNENWFGDEFTGFFLSWGVANQSDFLVSFIGAVVSFSIGWIDDSRSVIEHFSIHKESSSQRSSFKGLSYWLLVAWDTLEASNISDLLCSIILAWLILSSVWVVFFEHVSMSFHKVVCILHWTTSASKIQSILTVDMEFL